MRLSSSLSGTSNGESAPMPRGRGYFERPELFAWGVRVGGVLAALEDVSMVDLVDFGVGVSMLSNAKCCGFWLLEAGRGLVFCSEYGLVGVSWKVFRIWFSC